jgi:hypothetical protein
MIVTFQKPGEAEKDVDMFVIGTCIAIDETIGGNPTRIRLTQSQWKLLADIAERKGRGE